MDEITKIVIAIGTGVLYFWVLSRRKPADRTPKEAIPPSTRKKSTISAAATPPPAYTPPPKPKPKTNFGKILEELQADKPQDLPDNVKEVSKQELRNPLPLVRKDVNEKISKFEEEEQERRNQRMTEFENYKENVIKKRKPLVQDKEKEEEFDDADVENFMEKLRKYQHKAEENNKAHAIAKALADFDEVKRAMIIAEILNKKY